MTLQGELDHKDQWKKLSQQELDEVLDKHEKFVNNQRDGERAQSGMHDLSHLDMAGKNLSRAELTGGILNYYNLSGAMMNDEDMRDGVLLKSTAEGRRPDAHRCRGHHGILPTIQYSYEYRTISLTNTNTIP